MNDFQQTVNLRDKMERKKVSNAEGLEKIYEASENEKSQLKKINRPKSVKLNPAVMKRIIFILAIIVLGLSLYFIFFRGNRTGKVSTENWYAVKLVDQSIYYGQIKNTTADPVIVENVYYDYDQAKGEKKNVEAAGNLRLVKRGQEAHGPSGTMDIVRAQILFMEPLKSDSKVLKAILEYEK